MRKASASLLWQTLTFCVLLASCTRDAAPVITSTNSLDVVTEGAKAIADSKLLPTGYCVDTRLDARKTVSGGPKDADGWTSEAAAGLRYRMLESPVVRTLPSSAVRLLPAGTIRTDCLHRLVLHEPQFVEVRQRGEHFIYAMLAVDDRCPLCGAGYTIGLRMHGERWKTDTPAIVSGWIS